MLSLKQSKEGKKQMKNKVKHAMSILLVLCLLLGGLPVFATGNEETYTVSEKHTEIPAQYVLSQEGYASILIEGTPLTEQERNFLYDMLAEDVKRSNEQMSPEEQIASVDDLIARYFDEANFDEYCETVAKNNSVEAVVSPDGTIVMPFVRNPGNRETANRYYISNGVISRNNTGTDVTSNTSEGDGYFDLTGRPLFDQTYQYGRPFYNGVAFVRTLTIENHRENEFGEEMGERIFHAYLIDKSGKILLDLSANFAKCNGMSDSMHGMLFTMLGSCGAYSEDLIGFSHELELGKSVLEEKNWGDPLAYKLCGYMDLQGNVVIPQKYYEARPFSGGMAAVQSAEVKTVYRYWDNEREEIVQVETPDAAPDPENVSEDIAAVPGKWGFIDKNGNTVIPFIYDVACSFVGDYAAVTKDGKDGVIDRSGNTVVPFTDGKIYDSVDQGLYVIVDDNGAAVKSVSGKVVWSVAANEYEDISKVSDGVVYYVKDGKLNIVTIDKDRDAGDVDGDNVVAAADARLALRAAVGLERYRPGSAVYNAADANHDGILSAEDARLILRASVGLEKLPA